MSNVITEFGEFMVDMTNRDFFQDAKNEYDAEQAAKYEDLQMQDEVVKIKENIESEMHELNRLTGKQYRLESSEFNQPWIKEGF